MRILFLGNSFTARNSLPDTVSSFINAALPSEHCEIAQVTPGGASLIQHVRGEGCHRLIHDGKWDYVVLQEQSTKPIKHPHKFLEAAMKIIELVKQANAIAVWYMTWPRIDAPTTLSSLTEGYFKAHANSPNSLLARVGEAWIELDSVTLWDKDGSHPSPVGSYLAATIVSFSILLRCNFNAVDLEALCPPLPKGVDEEVAKCIRALSLKYTLIK